MKFTSICFTSLLFATTCIEAKEQHLQDGGLEQQLLRHLGSKSKKAECLFDAATAEKETTITPNLVHENGQIIGCMKASKKHCGEDLRLLPSGVEECDGKDEVQFEMSATGKEGPKGKFVVPFVDARRWLSTTLN